MIYLLIIIFLIFLFWPRISMWLRKLMLGRMEDAVRKATGQPTRKEERRQRRQQEKAAGKGRSSRFRRRSEPEAEENPVHPAAMMKEVAEDVEFTEIREFSQESIATETSGPGRRKRVVVEEQVEDAEYTEIKTKTSFTGK